ncbi:MAG: ferrous iron transport protein B, partial [Deltaproteobacteria bacterium]|nr:ferrous iron transport protein B [Deltaproteobacteria bacterium]
MTAVIALAGNPNAGKTTLFNALTGARAKVGNYPGVTVERRVGRLALGDGKTAEVLDVPGTYSLSARSPEEEVAVETVLPWSSSGQRPDLVVVVVDATALERNLYLALQILETGLPVVVALAMMDEARSAGLEIDVDRLSLGLGATIVPVVAPKGEGIAELRRAIETTLAAAAAAKATGEPGSAALEIASSELARDVAEVERGVREALPRESDAAVRARATWALLSLGDDELLDVPPAVRQAAQRVRERATAEGRNLDRELVALRFDRIDALVRVALRRPSVPRRSWTDRLDGVLTHRVLGVLVFGVVMLVLFQALFAWAEPLMAGVEWAVSATQGVVRTVVPPGPLQGLLADGVVAGVGNVVVFVPQIAILFLFLGVLEDSGYLARVAFVIDRVMAGVGLHGRAFVPLLSGFACAIPAVMATRTIESRRDRLVTMLALPLTSCSARLPVYTLVIATVFAGDRKVLGILSLGGLVMLAMYVLSAVAALSAAAVLRRTVLKGPRPPLVLELPPYRRPTVRNLALGVWARVKAFLIDAGTVILAITIVLWALLAYPRSDEVSARYDAQRAAVTETGEERDARIAHIDAAEAREQIEHSAGGRLGRIIEPAIRPLGFDWKIGIGLIGSFAAREVLVSTLGIVYGIGDADEESEPLREALRSERHRDGALVFTPLAGVSLMVFFVLACQCMSTIAVVRRESGSWRWP